MRKSIFLQAYEFLNSGQKIVLARIIDRTGSAPRAVGSKCIIKEDGTIVGTVGGGFLEHMVLERANGVLDEGKSCIYHLQLTGKDVSKSDMICGGVVGVYLDPLFPENRDTVELFRSVKELTENGRRGTLLTLVCDGISALDGKKCMLVTDTGIFKGEIHGLKEKAEELSDVTKPCLVEFPDSDTRVFAEPLEIGPVLFLFGAGHVSTFVAPLAKMVGFRVAVIDDRPEFANKERFPDADEIYVLPFPEAFEHITVTKSSYIAIITRGHTYDRIVLESALRTEPAYIGMIGSRKKRELIYQALREKGVPGEEIERVCSPIGIDIDAETPEEIAVSIVAELIAVRAGRA
ncbi:MAG: XdhC family protein [Candidatus Hydrogenedentota bacterium]|nr:MAG: XdhC family protein [Candidatus Hydrogenedentota bacterium]